MKKYILTLFIIFITALSAAQTTTVTATVTAPDGQVFANGTVTAIFNPPGGITQQSQYKLNGNTFPYFVTGSMDGSGTFSIVLTDDHAVRPFGGRWQFQVCPNVSISCTQSLQDVFGGSINLSTLISTDVKNFNGTSLNLPRFYADGEASASNLGGQVYFNWNSKSARLFDGSGWVDLAGTGGGSFVAKIPTVDQEVQPDAAHATVVGITPRCPTGAAAGLNCFRIKDASGNIIGSWNQDGSAYIPNLNGMLSPALPITDLGAVINAFDALAISQSKGLNINLKNIGFAVNISTAALMTFPDNHYYFGAGTVTAINNTAAIRITGDRTEIAGTGTSTIFDFQASTLGSSNSVIQVSNGTTSGNIADDVYLHDFQILGNRVTVCNPGGCTLGGGGTHGASGIRTGASAPSTMQRLKVERVLIINAGAFGITIDNCISCTLRDNYISQSYNDGMQINSSQGPLTSGIVGGVYGDLVDHNWLIDTNTGCGQSGCGDGELNIISTGGVGALGPTMIKNNFITNGVFNTALCNLSGGAPGGGATGSTGCGQGIQAVYKASQTDIIGNQIYNTYNEGIAGAGYTSISNNYVFNNGCCASGAGPIAYFVLDDLGVGYNATISNNHVGDGFYGISVQVGNKDTTATTDTAILDGITVTGNSIHGSAPGGANMHVGIRVSNNCTFAAGCTVHNSTIGPGGVVIAGNVLSGAINLLYQRPSYDVGSGTAEFFSGYPSYYGNSPAMHMLYINKQNQTAGLTSVSMATGTTGTWRLNPGTYYVCYNLTSTVAGTGTTIHLHFAWTDSQSIARTYDGPNVDVSTTAGNASECRNFNILTNTDILVSTQGTLGTSHYSLETYGDPTGGVQ